MRGKYLIAVLCLATFGMASANATPILVQPDSSTSSATITLDSFCFCSAHTELADTLGSSSMMLEVGSSWTFDFFDIIVGGITLGTAATVEATLGFTSPSEMVSAIGHGGFATFLGHLSGGVLLWDQPANIMLEDGSWLSVEFEDILELGLGDSATVSATVGRHASVPEPSTLALLGIGLLGIGMGARRKKSAAA